MGILNTFQGKVNDANNLISNPFSAKLVPPFDGADFQGGFIIEEILSNGNTGELVTLIGNMMPKIPFTFGGKQRVKKEYYAGYSEPAVHVLGSEENDLTISGTFKDKRYKDLSLKDVATEIQKLVDSIRIRGNLVRIRMGEFERYAIILETKFDMRRLSNLDYSITFSIIGFNAPENAKHLQRSKEFPFSINKDLIQAAAEFQAENDNIPDSIPRSIGDQIKALTSTVAVAIGTVTGFVDNVMATAEDVRSSLARAKGLIKYTQGKLNGYKRTLGAMNHFDLNAPITARYQSARFYTGSIARAGTLTALLERLRQRLAALRADTPMGRHLVRQGDTLQKIAIKWYGSQDSWRKIYDYNNLASTDLSTVQILQIPRP